MNAAERRALKAEVDRRRREQMLPAAPRRSWTRAEILARIREFVEAEGRLPRKVDLDSDERLPSRKTLVRHFGSTAEAFDEIVKPAEPLRLFEVETC